MLIAYHLVVLVQHRTVEHAHWWEPIRTLTYVWIYG